MSSSGLPVPSAPAYLSKLFSVSGKTVLVTGGSRGIGLQIARGFVLCGARVLLTSRDAKACEAAAASLSSSSSSAAAAGLFHGEGVGTCEWVTSNVNTRSGCEELALRASDIFDGRLDILINNAGTSWGEPLDRTSSDRSNWGWDKVLDLNVKGMFYLTRACLPLLERAAAASMALNGGGGGDPSRVINVGSVAGLVTQEAPTHAYDISKAAVHHLTRKFAAEFAPKRITVNALAPGFVPSRMSKGLETWGGRADKLAAAIPLGRMGEDDDMAGACLYLSSRAGAWVTGVVLPVDGGTVGAMQIPLSSL